MGRDELLAEKYKQLAAAKALVRELELEISALERDSTGTAVNKRIPFATTHVHSVVRPTAVQGYPRSTSLLGEVVYPHGGPHSAPNPLRPENAQSTGILRIIP